MKPGMRMAYGVMMCLISACSGVAATPTASEPSLALTPTQAVEAPAPPTQRIPLTPTSSPVAAREVKPTPSAASPRLAAATQPAVVKVQVGEYFFEPQVITLTVGTTVEWIPVGDRPHSIVSFGDQPAWKGYVGDAGSPAFRFTFEGSGTFSYTCDVHPGVMDGFIVVVEGEK